MSWGDGEGGGGDEAVPGEEEVTHSQELIAAAENIVCERPEQANTLRQLIEAYSQAMRDVLRLENTIHLMRK
jgi:hypothetical protein